MNTAEDGRPSTSRLPSWLNPPIIPGDEEATRIAGLAWWLLLPLTGLTALGVVLGFIALGPAGMASVLTYLIPSLLLDGVILLVLRAGYVRAACIALVALVAVLLSADVVSAGAGVTSPGFPGLVIVVIVAGLLLGGVASFVVAGLAIAFGVILLLSLQGAPLAPVSPPTALLSGSMYFLVSAVVLFTATRSLRSEVRRARKNEAAAVLSNRELQALRADLEARNERLRATAAEYEHHMNAVASGNLSGRLAIDGTAPQDDPLAALGRRLNETTASLQRMTAQVSDAAADVSAAAAEILAATTQQAAGAAEQSAAISQTTTTINEVRTISEQSTGRARDVAGAAQRTVQVSRAGQQSVQQTIGSMSEIKDKVEGIAENILALSEKTQQIGEIISSVSDLAAQSNMLALNASVEAARAGEHGKGFAIVAAEVRTLAEQSRQATTQIREILSEIQRATNAAVMATEEGTKGVDVGVQQATHTRQAIEQLAGVIDEAALVATQMVAGGQQQTAGVEQVALAMQNINQATVQNLASTRQAEKAAQHLNELANRLSGIVAQYRL